MSSMANDWNNVEAEVNRIIAGSEKPSKGVLRSVNHRGMFVRSGAMRVSW